jgi:hypothetical protein
VQLGPIERPNLSHGLFFIVFRIKDGGQSSESQQ